MLLATIPLLALSLISLITGVLWLLLADRQRVKGEGQDDTTQRPDELQGNAVEVGVRGTAGDEGGRTRERGVSYSFPEIKKEIREGRWNTAAPLLLAVGGFLGLLVSGSLAVYMMADNKLVGILFAGIAIFAAARVIVAMVRA